MDYIIKFQNEDFVVREVSLLPADLSQSNDSDNFTYLTLIKSGFTTFEAVTLVANVLGVEVESVNYEGLKDEDGVTYQLYLLIDASLSLILLGYHL
ncbi:MAG TPA: tRNA pseudouridine(13) synthase TruD [Candidatus Dormibacteraeota bacterium]|nr:tRNA pseudouridine(13) synthase TruD [Candidatus Dormibacteraeota bacterium]